jgi:diguanylate cyclase (GGDEF)-like protein
MECHGEPAGDLMLRACTDFFVAARREMDLVARFDSDVFAIGLPGTFLLDAVKVGSRLKTQIENCPLQIADMKTRFTIAVGVAEAQPAEDLVSFLGRTEQAQQASSKSADARVHHHNGTTIEPAPQSNKVQRSILVN